MKLHTHHKSSSSFEAAIEAAAKRSGELARYSNSSNPKLLLQCIYNHPNVWNKKGRDSNEFWNVLKEFQRDVSELQRVVAQLNNNESMANITKLLKLQLKNGYKSAVPKSQMTEELRMIFLEETERTQPPLPVPLTSSALDEWDKVLKLNLRFDDHNVWRYDTEKVWAAADVYRRCASRSILDQRRMNNLDFCCLNLTVGMGFTVLSEFLAKTHEILIY